ncbi:hypothetical protein IDSA_05780 [Pseudidiomarina salinarum]|uniref:Uncharacterized protein n=1 Tax=Pseudidiomarina salinarum TaxID=435908 RepID=A0A094L5Q2_9GAMM|nr:hypothetical protein [Pseudidiomarina salinarum]KFZ30053.1 hypothetical protein IDSA_05780 [Pseudidiomarina salinarum]RUO70068.1 hypothetical protein CWI79_00965 [Pseudidiomarina salinarum]
MVDGLLIKIKSLGISGLFLICAVFAMILGVVGSILELDYLNGFMALSGSLVVAFAASYNNAVTMKKAKITEEVEKVRKFNLMIGELKSATIAMSQSFSLVHDWYADKKRDILGSLRYLAYLKKISISHITVKNPLDFYDLLSSNDTTYKAVDPTKVGKSSVMLWDLSYFIRIHNELEEKLIELEKYRDIVSKLANFSGKECLTISFKFEGYQDKFILIKYITLYEEILEVMEYYLVYGAHILVHMPPSVLDFVEANFESAPSVAISSFGEDELMNLVKEMRYEKMSNADVEAMTLALIEKDKIELD